jgi:hypothetical protein
MPYTFVRFSGKYNATTDVQRTFMPLHYLISSPKMLKQIFPGFNQKMNQNEKEKKMLQLVDVTKKKIQTVPSCDADTNRFVIHWHIDKSVTSPSCVPTI